ncbi:MAG: adenylate kinase [Chitinophagales bacterium]|nr:adenylate kinase [Chitinophagales bacterium]
MYNLVIFGPPGAGKGTQSDKIIAKYQLKHISTGDMFRTHIANKTELGREVQGLLDNGILVPDEITIRMLENEMSQHTDVKGFILDGFPRTVPQAEALDKFLESKGQKVNLVLELVVSQSEIEQRIAERAKVSGRADDNAEKLIKRIDEYFTKTVHVLPYYETQGKVSKVNGIGEIEVIFGDITKAIDSSL